jgi:hypothetical protein
VRLWTMVFWEDDSITSQKLPLYQRNRFFSQLLSLIPTDHQV